MDNVQQHNICTKHWIDLTYRFNSDTNKIIKVGVYSWHFIGRLGRRNLYWIINKTMNSTFIAKKKKLTPRVTVDG
jgi:hypothetical protein